MLKKRRIGVLMGGVSAERDVSLRSGSAVIGALKGLGYDVKAIDVKEDIAAVLLREKINVAFLALHGGMGENGSMQGFLDVMGIPYTGSGVLASALSMDKVASRKIFLYHGIHVPEFRVLLKGKGYVLGGMGFPLVVKPAEEGSSIGISIVRNEKNFDSALDKAFSYGDRAIIEKYIEGREVQIGILNDLALGGVEVRPTLEFYSYEAKYKDGLTKYVIPPEIDGAAYERVKEAAVSAHKALGCRGATRVDLILGTDGIPYVLEVNTIPGMTETSLLPKIAKHAGLGFQSLVEEMLKEALKR